MENVCISKIWSFPFSDRVIFHFPCFIMLMGERVNIRILKLWLMIHQGLRFQNRSKTRKSFIGIEKEKIDKTWDPGDMAERCSTVFHNQMHLTLQIPIPRKKKTWEFPKIGVPHKGWFIMENPIKMDDLGVPLFLETPTSKFSTFYSSRRLHH